MVAKLAPQFYRENLRYHWKLPKNGANDQIWSNERSQPVVTKLAIVDDLQILLVNPHIANYAKFQPFFAVMARNTSYFYGIRSEFIAKKTIF